MYLISPASPIITDVDEEMKVRTYETVSGTVYLHYIYDNSVNMEKSPILFQLLVHVAYITGLYLFVPQMTYECAV